MVPNIVGHALRFYYTIQGLLVSESAKPILGNQCRKRAEQQSYSKRFPKKQNNKNNYFVFLLHSKVGLQRIPDQIIRAFDLRYQEENTPNPLKVLYSFFSSVLATNVNCCENTKMRDPCWRKTS